MDLLDSLRGKIDEIVWPTMSGKSEHICIIDPPNYPNVGDSAILLGQLAFIDRNFPDSRLSFYDADSYSQDADRYIDEASILVMQGGGNFGDIWMHHHSFRKHILDRFPEKPIVHFPQSLSFRDKDELKATADVIGRHRDFTLLVRDENSLAFARREFDCDVRLSPDMAFAMAPLQRKAPSVDFYCLLRQDKEVAANHTDIRAVLADKGGSVEVGDWLTEPNSLIKKIDHKAQRLTHRRPALTAAARSIMMRVRRRYAQDRLAYGIDLLSRGRTVVTDRLHAHIMCCLLDIPHFVFDSLDGKVSALNAAWTKDYAKARMLSSADDLDAAITSARLNQ